MTRSHLGFACQDEMLAGTLDSGHKTTGLLIVSGGNEIRSGAHSGMAKLADLISDEGFPVFRYDRRGIGDSSGENNGFLSTEADIAAAVKEFRELQFSVNRIVTFGNCDAATALALFGGDAGIDELILANPWVIEEESTTTDQPTSPPPSAVRARYWERIKNPRSIIDLLTGKIDLRKLVKGLGQAAASEKPSNLAIRFRDAISTNTLPTKMLLAKRDTTALAFQAAWKSYDFQSVRAQSKIDMASYDTASHSFADEASNQWLLDQILEVLNQT